MICKICCNNIEQERLEVLPSTVFCSSCAHKHNVVKPRKGVMVYGHKTAGEIQIMNADLFEETRKYYVPNGARSVMKNFSKNVCD
jgi:hypothetical protein